MKKIFIYTVLCVFALLMSNAFANDLDKQEKALRRLSNAVLGVWWEGDKPTESEILQRVAKADKSLLSHFGSNSIRIFIISDDPVVMICTPDQKQAIFEDIPCTAQVETRRYELTTPCKPQLDPINYCQK